MPCVEGLQQSGIETLSSDPHDCLSITLYVSLQAAVGHIDNINIYPHHLWNQHASSSHAAKQLYLQK